MKAKALVIAAAVIVALAIVAYIGPQNELLIEIAIVVAAAAMYFVPAHQHHYLGEKEPKKPHHHTSRLGVAIIVCIMLAIVFSLSLFQSTIFIAQKEAKYQQFEHPSSYSFEKGTYTETLEISDIEPPFLLRRLAMSGRGVGRFKVWLETPTRKLLVIQSPSPEAFGTTGGVTDFSLPELLGQEESTPDEPSEPAPIFETQPIEEQPVTEAPQPEQPVPEVNETQPEEPVTEPVPESNETIAEPAPEIPVVENQTEENATVTEPANETVEEPVIEAPVTEENETANETIGPSPILPPLEPGFPVFFDFSCEDTCFIDENLDYDSYNLVIEVEGGQLWIENIQYSLEPVETPAGFLVEDAEGKKVRARASAFSGGSLVSEIKTLDELVAGEYDIELEIEGYPARKVLVEKANVDGIARTLLTIDKGFFGERSYAIRTEVPAETITVEGKAKGSALYLCSDWNFARSECSRSYVSAQNLTKNEIYSSKTLAGSIAFYESLEGVVLPPELNLANITEVNVTKLKEDLRYEVVIDNVTRDESGLTVVFHHNYSQILPVLIDGEINHTLSAGTISQNEQASIFVPNYADEYFRIKIGAESEVLGFGNPREFDVDITAKDAAGTAIQAEADLIDEFTGASVAKNAKAKIKEGKHRLKLSPASGPVRLVEFNGINVRQSITAQVGIDDAPESGGYIEVYAIDPTQLNFTDANVTIDSARGTALYKCTDWNFTSQSCGTTCTVSEDGTDCTENWIYLRDIVPGQPYSFVLTAQDPGFGEFNASQAEGETSTTSSSHVTVTQLNFSSSSAGQYLLIGSAELQGSTTTLDVKARFLLNGTFDVGNYSWQPDTSRTGNPPGDYTPAFTHYLTAAGASVQNFSVQVSAENASTTAFIRRARAIGLQVTNGDAVTNDTGPISQSMPVAFTNMVTLSYTSPSTRQVLVLASAELNLTSTTQSARAQLVINGTVHQYADLEAEAVTDRESFAAAVVVTVPANIAQNISIQGSSETAIGKGIRNARVTVVPLDEFFYNNTDAFSLTTSAVTQNKTFVYFDLPIARSVLIIASAEMNISSATNGQFFSGELFIDNTLVANHTRGASDQADWYPFITAYQADLSAGAHTARIGYRSAAGTSQAGIRRAHLVVIPLDMDLIAPAITIQHPQNTTYSQTTLDLNYTATDNVGLSQCWYSLDGGANTTLGDCANSNFTTSTGSHIITVYANDTSNNLGSVSVGFSVSSNAPPPSISFVAPTDANDSQISTRNYTYVNASITNSSALDAVNIEWNRTNLTIFKGTLLGAWDFNNNTLDISGRTSHGTQQNGLNCSSTISAQFGTGCDFDGTDDRLLINTPDAAFPNVVGDVTITAVVKKGTDSTWDAVVSRQVGTTNGWTFEIDNTNSLYYDHGTVGTSTSGSMKVTASNGWVFIAVTKSAGSNLPTFYKYVYSNGSWTNVTGSGTAFGNSASTTQDPVIGAWWQDASTTTDYFSGIMDEVRIYRKILTQDELNLIARAAIGQYFANLTRNQLGTYSYKAFANDTSGATNVSETRVITFTSGGGDTTVPQVAFVSPTPANNSVQESTTVIINVSHTESNPDKLVFYVDGVANTTVSYSGSYTNRTFTLSEGNHNFSVTANDTSGNSNSTGTRFVTMDTTGPAISFVSPTPASGTNLSTPSVTTINATTSETASTAILEWNGVNESMGGSGTVWNKTKTDLADGTYTYKIYANDSVSNIGVSATRIVKIDATLPTVSFASPTPANNSNQSSTTIVMNVSHTETNPDIIIFYIDGIANLTLNYSGSYTNRSFTLGEGIHNFSARVNDSAGNTASTGTRFVTIDTTSPTISITVPANNAFLRGSKHDINGTASDTNSATIATNDSRWNTNSGTYAAWSFRNTSNVTDGFVQVRITANDTSGSSAGVTANFTVDNTNPAVAYVSPTPVAVANLSSGTIIINVTHTETNPDKIVFFINGIANTTLSYSGAYTNRTFTLGEGEHNFSVTVNDSAGNSASTAVRTILIDTIAPIVSFVSPTPANNSVQESTTVIINVSHTETNSDKLLLYIDGVLNLTQSYSGSYTNFTRSLGAGSRNYSVTVNDTTGNSASTGTRFITIDAVPVVSNVVLNSTSGNSLNTDNFTVTFTASDANGDAVKNITNWYRNATSITTLNFPFEANGGSEASIIKDYTGRYNGSTNGSMTWNSSGGYDGWGAYQFDAINDHIYGVPNSTISRNEGSIEVWAKPSHFVSPQMLVWAGEAGANGYSGGPTQELHLSIQHFNSSLNQNGFTFFYGDDEDSVQDLGGGTNHTWLFSGSLAAGQWYHVIVTWKFSNESRIYVNGTLATVDDMTSDPAYDTSLWQNDIYIGRPGTEARYFNGTIDEVRIYNKVLSTQQVLALYQNKTTTIVEQETEVNDVWKACVTPNDKLADGAEVCSNNLTIVAEPDTRPPSFFNLTETPADPATYAAGQVYTFNATWTDGIAVDRALIEFSGTNYTATKVGSTDVYTRNFTPLAAATWSYKWYANDTAGNLNVTSGQTYTINKAATILTITFSPSATITFGTQSNASCSANNNEVSPQLYRDSATVSNPDIQTLAAGSYLYVCNNTASQNYTAASTDSTLTVNKASAVIDLKINGLDGSQTIERKAVTNFTATLTTPSSGAVNITENISLLASGASVLSASKQYNSTGTFALGANYAGNQNYTAISENATLTVQDTTPPNQVSGFGETAVGTNSIIWSWTNPTDDDFSHIMVYLNSAFQTNTSASSYNASGLQDATTYNLTLRAVDTYGNINPVNVTDPATTLDGTKPQIGSLTEPADPSTYSAAASYDFTATITDNVNVSVALLEFNGLNYSTSKAGSVYNKTLVSLAAATYNYKWYANDTGGNLNVTAVQTFTISKAASSVNLTLNGIDGNTTVEVYSIVNHTATRLTGESVLEIYRSNSLAASGTSPLTNLSNYTSLGTINVTAVYPESQNFTRSSETHYIIAQDTTAPAASLSSPANNTNSSSTSQSFVFTATDNFYSTLNCTLYINSTASANNASTQAGISTSFSLTTGEGTKNWYANCIDGSVNSGSSLTRVLRIDITAPTITHIRPVQSEIVGFTVTLDIDPADNLVGVDKATYIIRNSTGSTVATGNLTGASYQDTWNSALAADSAGYNFSVTVNDTVGNSRNSSVIFTVDNTAPFIQILSPTNNSRWNTNFNLNISYQNTRLNVTSYNITNSTGAIVQSNSTTNVNAGTYSFTDAVNMAGLRDGNYTLRAFAKDIPGYTDSAASNFIIDKTAPSYSGLVEGQADPSTYSPSGAYQFNATWTDNYGATVVLEFDGINYTDFTQAGSVYSKAFGPLAAGTHSYKWYASDQTGNQNVTATQTYTINRAASAVNLTINGTEANITTNDIPETISIAGNVTTGQSAIEVYRNGTLIANGTHSVSHQETFSTEGTFDINLTYIETQNYTTSSKSYIVTAQDKKKPVIALLSPANSSTDTDGSVLFVYNVTDRGSDVASCTLYINGVLNETDTTITESLSQNFSKIFGNSGSRTWRVDCTDTASTPNTGSSENRTISINLAQSVNVLPVASKDTNRTVAVTHTITINNTGTEPDNFTLSLLNIDNASTASLNQTLLTNVLPGQTRTATLSVTDDDTVGAYRVNVTAMSVLDPAIADSETVTTDIYGVLSATLTSPTGLPTISEGQNVTLKARITDEFSSPVSGATATFEPINGALVYLCSFGTEEAAGNYTCTKVTTGMASTLAYAVRTNATKTFYRTASNLTPDVFVLGVNKAASLTLEKAARVLWLNSTHVAYNITLTLTNARGTSLNTTIADPNSTTYQIGAIGAQDVKRNYSLVFARGASDVLLELAAANATGIDALDNSSLFAASNAPLIIIPQTAAGIRLAVLKNAVYLTQTDTNATFKIIDEVINTGTDNATSITFVDSDIDTSTIIPSLAPGASQVFQGNTSVNRLEQTFEHTFVNATSSANATIFGSNRPKVNITGSGGPFDISITSLPTSVAMGGSITGTIQLVNQNPEIEDDRVLVTQIKDASGTIYDQDIRTVFIGKNSSATFTVSLNVPAGAGTYTYFTRVTWPSSGQANASKTFEAVAPSEQEAAAAGSGLESARLPREPSCGDGICLSSELRGERFECLADCGYDCNQDGTKESWLTCGSAGASGVPEDVIKDIVFLKNKLRELSERAATLKSAGADTRELGQIIADVTLFVEEAEALAAFGHYEAARNTIRTAFGRLSTVIITGQAVAINIDVSVIQAVLGIIAAGVGGYFGFGALRRKLKRKVDFSRFEKKVEDARKGEEKKIKDIERKLEDERRRQQMRKLIEDRMRSLGYEPSESSEAAQQESRSDSQASRAERDRKKRGGEAEKESDADKKDK